MIETKNKYWVYGYRLRDGSLNFHTVDLVESEEEEAYKQFCDLCKEIRDGESYDSVFKGFLTRSEAAREYNYCKGY